MPSATPRRSILRPGTIAVALALAHVASTTFVRDAHAQVVEDRIVLEVDGTLVGLDPEALRRAIADELEIDVALAGPEVRGRGLVRVERAAPHAGDDGARVSFRDEHGKLVERTIALPASPTVALETVTLIVSNLVRDQAADLLARMRKAKVDAKRVDAPAIAKTPTPAPKIAPPAIGRPSGPCSRADLWLGADLLPFLGTSSLEGGRGATRALSIDGLGLSGGVRGASIGAIGSIALGTTCGAQIAGAFNVAARTYGAQIAPVNVTAGDVTGAQVGVVNVASGDVRGVQLGVVNVAKDGDASIGLVSFFAKGRTHVDGWATENGHVHVGVVHGGRVVHNVYGIGQRIRKDADDEPILVYGLGARLLHEDVVSLDLDVLVSWLTKDTARGLTLLPQLRLVFGIEIVKRMSVLVGPTYTTMITTDPAKGTQSAIEPATFASGGTRVLGWPGVTIGVRAP